MNDSDKILDLLLKGIDSSLTNEEYTILKESLNIDEIEDFSEILHSYNQELYDFEPSTKVKSNLLNHFNQNHSQPKGKTKRMHPLLLKFSAAAILVIGIGACLFFLFPNEEKSSLVKDSNELMSMDFEQVAETEETENNEMKQETRYLLNVDFFSNSDLFR